MTHTAALLSGGVDSAAALSRYIEADPRRKKSTRAYYLKIWLESEMAFLGSCPWEEDIYYAEKTARALDIPFETISLQREYYERVVSYTVEELRLGRTPSPDIFCNLRIKFGAFFEHTDAKLIISGHYARAVHSEAGAAQLHRAEDRVKDQTYFLAHLPQETLARLHFPLCDVTKAQVRTYAAAHELAPQSRKDSQGICFLGKIPYDDFIKYYMGEKEGRIVNETTGEAMGVHRGSWFYTIGQRKGLGLSGGPWYVSGKNQADNIVWVRHQSLPRARRIVPVEACHSVAAGEFARFAAADNTVAISVKLRHGPADIPAHFTFDETRGQGTLRLSRGDDGVAAGQFAVLYEGTRCLGCARIRDAREDEAALEADERALDAQNSAEYLSAHSSAHSALHPAAHASA